MMRSCALRLAAAAPILLVLAVTTAAAQDTRGTITGRVSDKSAAVLPGATITAVNVETGVPTSAVTNGEGNYLLPFLAPGKYRVTAELMGFKKYVRDGIELRIADRLTLDLALDVGQLEEVVSVHAESPLLDVSTSPTPPSRPTVSSTRPSSATISGSGWPTTSATSRTGSPACAARP